MNLPVSKRMFSLRTILIGRSSFKGPIAIVVISSHSVCLEISKNGGELERNILYYKLRPRRRGGLMVSALDSGSSGPG